MNIKKLPKFSLQKQMFIVNKWSLTKVKKTALMSVSL